jgi:integrase
MKQIKLTKANLEKLVANPPSQRDEYRTDIGGCYLRVGPSSMSISVLRRDSKKKQVRVSIPIDTLDLPNLPALKRLIRQAKESDSHSMKREKLLKTSLRSAGEYVIEAKQLASATEANYRRCLKQLVTYHDDKVPEKGVEIRKLHKLISEHHGSAGANSALKVLRMIMKTMHADDDSFPDWPTDAVSGLWTYEPPRETRLSTDQLPLVWNASLPDHWSQWVRFALLTGMRKSETKRAYKQGDELVVDNTKNGTRHRLPLTPSIEKHFSDYSSIRCFKPLTKHVQASTDIRTTPHDLRRTFASIARMAGVQQSTIAWLMNHSAGRSSQTDRYQGRPETFVLREALLRIEETYRTLGCEEI